MACCLTIPIYYLNQCWLTINGVLCHSLETISQQVFKISICKMSLKNPLIELLPHLPGVNQLIHWGQATHIWVSKLTIIGSDNGLSPDRHQAIIWTNTGLLLIGPLGTNFSEILIAILTFSFKKMRLKVSSAKRRPFCLGLNVLKNNRMMTVQEFESSYLQHSPRKTQFSPPYSHEYHKIILPCKHNMNHHIQDATLWITGLKTWEIFHTWEWNTMGLKLKSMA